MKINLLFSAVCFFVSVTIATAQPYHKMTPPNGERVIGSFSAELTETIHDAPIECVYTAHCLYVWEPTLFLDDGYHRAMYKTPPGKRILHATFSGRHYEVLLNDGTIVLIGGWDEEVFGTTQTTQSVLDEAYKKVVTGALGESFNRSVMHDPVYVLSNAGIYVTRDSFASWTMDTVGLGTTIKRDIDLDLDKNIYAATSGGLYFQDSAGLTDWVKNVALGTQNLQKVFTARNGDIYASSNNRIWKSDDDGTSWTLDTLGIGTLAAVSFGDDSLNNMYVITATGSNYTAGNRIYRKYDGSNQWQRVDESLSNTIADGSDLNIYTAITSGDTVIALATYYGVFSSDDYGVTWTERNNGLRAENYYGMVFNTAGRVFLSTGNGIYYKDPADTSWVKSFPENLWGGAQPLFRDNAGNLYTQGTEFNDDFYPARLAMKSTDEGDTWAPDTLGLAAIGDDFFAHTWYVDETGTQHYAVFGNGILPMRLYIKPVGQPWQSDITGFTSATSDQSTIFGTDNMGNIYLGKTGSSFCWKRSSSGTWTNISSGLQNSPYSFTTDGSGTMIAGTYDGVYQYSGSTWTELNQPSHPDMGGGSNAFAVGMDEDGFLFTCYGNFDPNFNNIGIDVFRSDDLGNTWENYGLDTTTIKLFVSHGDSTYGLSYHDGIFIFTNGDISTGVDEESPVTQLMSVYPNPNTGIVTISTASAKGMYYLYDLRGTLLLSGTINSTQFTLDISTYSAGVYVLNFVDGEGDVRVKVVKE